MTKKGLLVLHRITNIELLSTCIFLINVTLEPVLILGQTIQATVTLATDINTVALDDAFPSQANALSTNYAKGNDGSRSVSSAIDMNLTQHQKQKKNGNYLNLVQKIFWLTETHLEAVSIGQHSIETQMPRSNLSKTLEGLNKRRTTHRTTSSRNVTTRSNQKAFWSLVLYCGSNKEKRWQYLLLSRLPTS